MREDGLPGRFISSLIQHHHMPYLCFTHHHRRTPVSQRNAEPGSFHDYAPLEAAIARSPDFHARRVPAFLDIGLTYRQSFSPEHARRRARLYRRLSAMCKSRRDFPRDIIAISGAQSRHGHCFRHAAAMRRTITTILMTAASGGQSRAIMKVLKSSASAAFEPLSVIMPRASISGEAVIGHLSTFRGKHY